MKREIRISIIFSVTLCLCFEAAQHEAKKEKGGHTSEGRWGVVKGKGGVKTPAVNIEKIELLLDMIKGADVTSEDNLAENETILELEGQ